jgi:hypothetical protein
MAARCTLKTATLAANIAPERRVGRVQEGAIGVVRLSDSTDIVNPKAKVAYAA